VRFSDGTQRQVFTRFCKGNWRMEGLLPPHLVQAGKEAQQVHAHRGRVGGSNQDPLALRAKWAPLSECEATPEHLALAAIVGKPITCKCRTCRIRRAAAELRRFKATNTDGGLTRAWIFTNVTWASLPEAAITRTIAERTATYA